MALPVLPTTPFILLAAACFMYSSERAHAWLVDHPKFGFHIEDYLEGRGIRARAKIVAITTLWLSVGLSVWHFIPILWVDILVIVIAIGVTWYLLSLPTCPEDFRSERQIENKNMISKISCSFDEKPCSDEEESTGANGEVEPTAGDGTGFVQSEGESHEAKVVDNPGANEEAHG